MICPTVCMITLLIGSTLYLWFYVLKWDQHIHAATMEEKIMLFSSYLKLCNYKTAVSLKAASQHRLLPQHVTQRPDVQAMLWQTGPMPRPPSPIPVQSTYTLLVLPGRGPSPQIAWKWQQLIILPWSCIGGGVSTRGRCYEDPDARQFIVVQGLMCEARCGLKMQRMGPVSPFMLCIYVSACDSLIPMEQYGMDLMYGTALMLCSPCSIRPVKDEVSFLSSDHLRMYVSVPLVI